MEGPFPAYHVFINHRGPDVKKTLASLIRHALCGHGLRVFLSDQEWQVGESLTPATKSVIFSAAVQIAIFSKKYAESAWCLDELLWMLDSHGTIIPVFYDIRPSDLRYVNKGAYARAFQDHRDKGRVPIKKVDKWITALNQVAFISGVEFSTDKDDHGERLQEIVKAVLEKVGRQELYVCDYPVGLDEAAEHFEKEALSGDLRGISAVGIVGPGGSGKSTLATHLYNSKRSQFQRSAFLSDVSTNDLPSLQQTLLRDLLCDQNLRIKDTRRGRAMLQHRLRGLAHVLIVFDDIGNTEQIDNLLFVKEVVGNGSLILVTSRDQNVLGSYEVKIYNVKLLEENHAQELFCWHTFGSEGPSRDFQDMVKESVRVCGGVPLALKVLAGQLRNERDPRKWKQRLESLRKQPQDDLLQGLIKHSYESLDVREKEAFLDIAHFFLGEDTDMVERVLDGLNDNGFQCLQTLHYKCLVHFESADIILRRALGGESVNWSIRVWRRSKGSFKIRMHDLVREVARQIGRQELPLRLCSANDKIISKRSLLNLQAILANVHRVWNLKPRLSHHIGWIARWDGSLQCISRLLRRFKASPYLVRGIRRDEEHHLPVFLANQDICGLKLLAVQNSTVLQQFKSVSGDLIWLRMRPPKDTSNPSLLLQRSLSKLIPSTLSLRSLRVLEIHGVNPQDFCNLFDVRETPSELHALEVTFTKDFGSLSRAGSSTAVSTRLVSASDSLQPPINRGHRFQAWLGKLNLKNLGKIVLQNIQGLRTLPIKFEELRHLRHVDLSGCSDLENFPDSFTEELLQLKYLALQDCRKLVLPDLKKISTLEYLDFQGCSMLREMPRGTVVQKSLKHLNVVHTVLRKLPQQLEQLKYLEELHIGSSVLTEIPSSVYNLSRLTDLTLLGCINLLSIDNSIEKLTNLESLRIYKCGIRMLPKGIACMNMKILDVQQCPLDLEQLRTGLYERPNYSSSLKNLIIRESLILKLDIYPAECLAKLEIVDLSNNNLLTEIESLPDSLISLYLMNCSHLRILKCLRGLARLKVLDVSGCDGLETLHVEGLSSIEILNLTNCSELRTLTCLCNLTSLRALEISGCHELETLNVDGLSSIEVIRGNGCWKLQIIRGLKQLQKLSYVQISVSSSCRPRCGDIETGAHQFSAGIHCQKTMEEEYLDEMGINAEVSEDVRVLKVLESCTQVSVEIGDCNFTDVKLKGAILLYFITDPNCRIEVTFLDHAYTTDSSSFDNSVHILMWTKDSDVFKDLMSKEGAIRFNINVLSSNLLLNARLQKGWIMGANNVLQMSSFIFQVFRMKPATPFPRPDVVTWEPSIIGLRVV